MGELQPTGEAQSGRPLDDLPEWLLPRMDGTHVFSSRDEINQVAANEYKENAGISLHVENPTAFGANLATLSLLTPVEMTLVPADLQTTPSGVDHGDWLKIYLEPRSLLVMQGESRYEYMHGIRRSVLVEHPDGGVFRRGKDCRRVSLTFRELLGTRRQLLVDPSEDSSHLREQTCSSHWKLRAT